MKRIKAEGRVERKGRSLRRRKRIKLRLRDREWTDQPGPMLRGRNIHYEIAERDRGQRGFAKPANWRHLRLF